jgi:hypothetical protein
VDKNSKCTISSTWSEPCEEFDKRELERYFVFVKFLENTGKLILVLLILGLFLVITTFLFTGEFEQIIFTDGSELTCIYDNSTDNIVSVSK